MELLDLTLPSTAQNLALDEALLDRCHLAPEQGEVLRLWENQQPSVVIGRASKVHDEVHVAYCQEHQIPIYRRGSGGAAVVVGPGCLIYSVILSTTLRPRLGQIQRAHQFVLDRLIEALQPLVSRRGTAQRGDRQTMRRRGTSDLTWQGKKFSGNSLRCKRHAILYHGTILYDLPLELIARCLAMPPRQPDYRRDRSHESFVACLPVDPTDVRRQLARVWNCQAVCQEWPEAHMRRLTELRYANYDWTFRR